MAKQLAWIRSKNATGMMPLLMAATPTARTAHVVEMVLVIATTTPTMLTGAHDGD